MTITRAEFEELRRRVAEAHERERAGIVGSITVRLRLAERLLDAADERDRLEASRIAIMAKLGELHEHLALMVRYLEEETSQGDGIAEQHWDGYQGAKSALVRTAPDQSQWENAQIEISELLAKASEVPGLSATLDEVRGERDRLRELLAEARQVIADANPLGWVAAQDLVAASAWEKRASGLLWRPVAKAEGGGNG